MEPEEDGKHEGESWCEVAYSRRKSWGTIFYSFTTSYPRGKPVLRQVSKLEKKTLRILIDLETVTQEA